MPPPRINSHRKPQTVPSTVPFLSLLVSRDPPRSSASPVRHRFSKPARLNPLPLMRPRGVAVGNLLEKDVSLNVTGSSGSPFGIHQKEEDWQRLSHFYGVESKIRLLCRVIRTYTQARSSRYQIQVQISNIQSVVSSCLPTQIEVIHALHANTNKDIIKSSPDSSARADPQPPVTPSCSPAPLPNVSLNTPTARGYQNTSRGYTHTVERGNNSSQAGWAAP